MYCWFLDRTRPSRCEVETSHLEQLSLIQKPAILLSLDTGPTSVFPLGDVKFPARTPIMVPLVRPTNTTQHFPPAFFPWI